VLRKADAATLEQLTAEEIEAEIVVARQLVELLSGAAELLPLYEAQS
jgi:hypothetical protein